MNTWVMNSNRIVSAFCVRSRAGVGHVIAYESVVQEHRYEATRVGAEGRDPDPLPVHVAEITQMYHELYNST